MYTERERQRERDSKYNIYLQFCSIPILAEISSVLLAQMNNFPKCPHREMTIWYGCRQHVRIQPSVPGDDPTRARNRPMGRGLYGVP